MYPKALDFVRRNPLATSTSYTKDDLSLLMLAVKFVTSVDFISSLIELIAVEKKLPLKLAKKSVHD